MLQQLRFDSHRTSYDDLGERVRAKIAGLGIMIDDAAEEIGCDAETLRWSARGGGIRATDRKKMEEWLASQGPDIIDVHRDENTGRWTFSDKQHARFRPLGIRIGHRIKNEMDLRGLDYFGMASLIGSTPEGIRCITRGAFPGKKNFYLIRLWLQRNGYDLLLQERSLDFQNSGGDESKDPKPSTAGVQNAEKTRSAIERLDELTASEKRDPMIVLREMRDASAWLGVDQQNALSHAVDSLEKREQESRDYLTFLEAERKAFHGASQAHLNRAHEAEVLVQRIDDLIEVQKNRMGL
jgi:hypothetical protein